MERSTAARGNLHCSQRQLGRGGLNGPSLHEDREEMMMMMMMMLIERGSEREKERPCVRDACSCASTYAQQALDNF